MGIERRLFGSCLILFLRHFFLVLGGSLISGTFRSTAQQRQNGVKLILVMTDRGCTRDLLASMRCLSRSVMLCLHVHVHLRDGERKRPSYQEVGSEHRVWICDMQRWFVVPCRSYWKRAGVYPASLSEAIRYRLWNVFRYPFMAIEGWPASTSQFKGLQFDVESMRCQ